MFIVVLEPAGQYLVVKLQAILNCLMLNVSAGPVNTPSQQRVESYVHLRGIFGKHRYLSSEV